ncbi:MAG: hypothetical protein Q4F29_09360 [Lachnospiraceae bacterium]|nr:hypothetical protein [Lachnospiraceae bacterium]
MSEFFEAAKAAFLCAFLTASPPRPPFDKGETIKICPKYGALRGFWKNYELRKAGKLWNNRGRTTEMSGTGKSAEQKAEHSLRNARAEKKKRREER